VILKAFAHRAGADYATELKNVAFHTAYLELQEQPGKFEINTS